jgi:hypothetical protein
MKERWLFPLFLAMAMMLVAGPFVSDVRSDVRDGAWEIGGFGGIYVMKVINGLETPRSTGAGSDIFS